MAWNAGVCCSPLRGLRATLTKSPKTRQVEEIPTEHSLNPSRRDEHRLSTGYCTHLPPGRFEYLCGIPDNLYALWPFAQRIGANDERTKREVATQSAIEQAGRLLAAIECCWGNPVAPNCLRVVELHDAVHVPQPTCGCGCFGNGLHWSDEQMIAIRATQEKVLAVLQSVAGIVERRNTLPTIAVNVIVRIEPTFIEATEIVPSVFLYAPDEPAVEMRSLYKAARYAETPGIDATNRRRREAASYWRYLADGSIKRRWLYAASSLGITGSP
jgi:hypothetical protein